MASVLESLYYSIKKKKTYKQLHVECRHVRKKLFRITGRRVVCNLHHPYCADSHCLTFIQRVLTANGRHENVDYARSCIFTDTMCTPIHSRTYVAIRCGHGNLNAESYMWLKYVVDSTTYNSTWVLRDVCGHDTGLC